MHVVVDGLLTNYQVTGRGKTVLMLHGWGDSLQGLSQLQLKLSAEHQALSLDLPGFGGTESPKEVWGLDDYANFVKDFTKKINITNLFAVVAHSNGGAIAIRAVAEDYLQADRLVLLSSAGIRGQYKGRLKAIRYVTKTGKLLTRPLPKSTRDKLKKIVYKTVGSEALVAENLQETFKKVVSDDIRSDAKKITQPTLLIYGENDKATPIEYGRILHELMSDSTLEIIGGAGHFIHLDKPQEVFKLITDFLQ